jgi:hypothetical protein
LPTRRQLKSNRRQHKAASAEVKKTKRVNYSFTKLALAVLNKHRGKPMTVAELLSAIGLPTHERKRGAAALSSSLHKKTTTGPLTRIKNFGVYRGYGYVWPVREPSMREIRKAVISILAETLTWREYNYVDEQTSRALFGRHDYEDVSHPAIIELWRAGLVDIRHPWNSDVERYTMKERQRNIPMMRHCSCRLTISGVLKERIMRESDE